MILCHANPTDQLGIQAVGQQRRVNWSIHGTKHRKDKQFRKLNTAVVQYAKNKCTYKIGVTSNCYYRVYQSTLKKKGHIVGKYVYVVVLTPIWLITIQAVPWNI